MRARYEHLVSHPGELEDVLQAGAAKARERTTPFLRDLRQAVGLRNLASAAAAAKDKGKGKSSLPAFKQFREDDGRFYFKFVDGHGRLLLQSSGFASPREAGQCIAALRQAQALPADGQVALAEGATAEQALAALRELSQG